jgi:hypothetical protein
MPKRVDFLINAYEIFDQLRGRGHDAPRVSFEEALDPPDEVRISTDELSSCADQYQNFGTAARRHGRPVHDPGSGEYSCGRGLRREFSIAIPDRPRELTIVITQAGETADTTAAQREAKARLAYHRI